ncbi:YceI family protein [Burkholderia humptydooensis]|uniref:YceI family protein n=3 Tax=Burkholderia humptydooensis TaxID=430531 RepID=A0A7U4PA63_9BURK|nr:MULTISPECIES: YceI family protein [Burkholderia]AJY39962.1 yceI-like domain protein [Burkholderia sp. 2002721687]ALX45802.1 hypothetical protein AQ610_25590 [Burkholderia humptydooensis]EIP86780.1 YceI like family protein [Burkholderia humptydooensis MSMB43]QPS47294.1 YceI family protein [Burkholderia humptydooensis]
MGAAGSSAKAVVAALACAVGAWLAPGVGAADAAGASGVSGVSGVLGAADASRPSGTSAPAGAADVSGAEPAGTLAASPHPAPRYRLDPRHSGVTFRVDNFWHAHLTMRFTRMHAELAGGDDDRLASRVDVTVDAASLGANVPFVAALVKGSAMLDVARYPEIRFVGTRFERTGAATARLTGDLTIRATTRPITLAVRFDAGQPGADARDGGERDSAWRREARGRREFGPYDARTRDAALGDADSPDAMPRDADASRIVPSGNAVRQRAARRGTEPPESPEPRESPGRPTPDAARTLAFVADGHFSRTAFGLSRWLPAVGDDVQLRIRAEFVRARAGP